jgi:hypothetical protein
LRILVLFEHPKVERFRGATLDELLRRRCQQRCADPVALAVAPHVQVVEEGSPLRVVLEHRVSEPDQIASGVGAHGEVIETRRSEAGRPDLATLRHNVAVEILIAVCTSIVASPTVSV